MHQFLVFFICCSMGFQCHSMETKLSRLDVMKIENIINHTDDDTPRIRKRRKRGNGDSTISCKLCSESIQTNCAAAHARKTHLLRSKNITCLHCNQIVPLLSSYKHHEEKHGGKLIDCDTCHNIVMSMLKDKQIGEIKNKCFPELYPPI
jgi:hypothetical protein